MLLVLAPRRPNCAGNTSHRIDLQIVLFYLLKWVRGKVKQLIEVGQPFGEEGRSLLEFPLSTNDLNLFFMADLMTRGQLGSLAFLA